MTLDQFIERLTDLRELTGGEIEVAVSGGNSASGEQIFEIACVEIQNVLPESFIRDDVKSWTTAPGQVNTGRIISVF